MSEKTKIEPHKFYINTNKSLMVYVVSESKYKEGYYCAIVFNAMTSKLEVSTSPNAQTMLYFKNYKDFSALLNGFKVIWIDDSEHNWLPFEFGKAETVERIKILSYISFFSDIFNSLKDSFESDISGVIEIVIDKDWDDISFEDYSIIIKKLEDLGGYVIPVNIIRQKNNHRMVLPRANADEMIRQIDYTLGSNVATIYDVQKDCR